MIRFLKHKCLIHGRIISCVVGNVVVIEKRFLISVTFSSLQVEKGTWRTHKIVKSAEFRPVN